MSISFKQIRPDKDAFEKDGFGMQIFSSLIFAGTLMILILLGTSPIIGIVATFFLAFILMPRIRKVRSDWAKPDDIVGILTFDSKKVSSQTKVQSITINFVDIIRIDFDYNYIQGEKFSYKDIIHNGIATINLLNKNDQRQELKFLIENKEQLDSLKNIFYMLYKQGINIRETMGKYKVKTVLFDGNLSFERLKTLKEELNVEKFY